MIVIGPLDFDPLDNVRIRELLSETDLGVISRRINRRATIDGGVWIDDSGFTEGDKTLTIVSDNAPPKTIERMADLAKVYSVLKVYTREGAFIGSVQTVKKSPKLEVVFMVKERTDV